MSLKDFRLCAGLAVLALLGCRDDPYETATVEGRLTCNGEPVMFGNIVFQPLPDPSLGRPEGYAGKPANGSLAPDGRFVLRTYSEDGNDGALIGRHKVTFSHPSIGELTRDLREQISAASGPEKQELEALLRRVQESPSSIFPCGEKVEPEEVEVVAGKNEFELKLRPKTR